LADSDDFERFRHLERQRPDRGSDSPRDPAVDPKVASRFGGTAPAEKPDAENPEAPLGCAGCGAENSATAKFCFNCGADLGAPEMRDYQRNERARYAEDLRRAAAELETRRREETEAAKKHLEERRRAAAAAKDSAANEPSEFWDSAWTQRIPVLALFRSARVISDPWLRTGARVAIGGAFCALVWYACSARYGYPLWLLLALLLGVRPRWGYGYRRWWW
jgi:hypothetical protein